MKKKKKLGLSLNKTTISELSNATQQKILGGTYPSACRTCNNCQDTGGGTNSCAIGTCQCGTQGTGPSCTG